MEKLGEGGLLPQDHEDQLQLGIRIISSAFQNKMHSLEQEIRGLRLASEEQRSNVSALQKKNSALEVELVESHQRSQQLAEENKELFKTVGNLRKQIARLDKLKSAVLSSIQDDAQHEVDHGEANSRVLMSDEYLRGQTPITSREMGLGPPGPAPLAAAPHQPQQPQQHYQEEAPINFGGPSSGHGLGAGGGGVDGKQFFKQARSRLSYEAFNLFLASIKRLNNAAQSREETLEEARRIFGPELADLYKDFETLLNRHAM
eukprot:TRINITY_DN37435_c0_g1_i1.p1 TRINITY_DN37435_c0_g1~~TRINITY_DN37435_c0_g1_i1.p1  ORF type:complete len:260 (-),score=66.68 TRINITY_DN37435_c0_g1_i1:87-866(-)